jgi:hypothetical protein
MWAMTSSAASERFCSPRLAMFQEASSSRPAPGVGTWRLVKWVSRAEISGAAVNVW